MKAVLMIIILLFFTAFAWLIFLLDLWVNKTAKNKALEEEKKRRD